MESIRTQYQTLSLRLYRFERELRAKLTQKATAHCTEETTLLKSFKYFDLDNNGNFIRFSY